MKTDEKARKEHALKHAQQKFNSSIEELKHSGMTHGVSEFLEYRNKFTYVEWVRLQHILSKSTRAVKAHRYFKRADRRFARRNDEKQLNLNIEDLDEENLF